MSETVNVGLTPSQRELLLQGLRFVRSSLTLDPRDPDEKLDAERDQALGEIRTLVDRLNGRAPAETANV